MMIVSDVTSQNSAEMIFVENDHMIQTLAADRTDHSFDESILPRTPGRCDHFLDLHPHDSPQKLFAVNLVTVSQQETRRRFVWARLDELLRRPGGRRMLGDIEMQHTPAIVRHHNQYI
jgi:hypothetical protein